MDIDPHRNPARKLDSRRALGPAAERKWTDRSGGRVGMTLTFFVLFRRAVIAAFLLSLSGCAGTTIESLRDPVPEQFLSSTVVPGYSHIRYWGDDPNGIPSDIVSQIAAQQVSSGNTNPQRSYLSISGGGSNGAFGAGVLFGWTDSGKRPEFTIVTGISTGSLVAPFAFLGPPYDRQLKAAYTETSGKDIYKKKGLLSIIGSESAQRARHCGI